MRLWCDRCHRSISRVSGLELRLEYRDLQTLGRYRVKKLGNRCRTCMHEELGVADSGQLRLEGLL
jgi:hypothetical protein